MSSSQEASPASSTSVPATKGTKGRPKGSQGESLIKRSKEVLGLDRVKDMQRRKKSTRDDQDQDSKASTRREQVLEAQRTHRMRTKIYIKELESEVLRLRKSEAAAVARAEMSEHKTQALVQVLHAHGIQPPSEHTVPSWDGGSHPHQEPYPGSRGTQNIPIHSRGSGAEAKPGVSAHDAPPHYQSHDHSLQLLPDNGDLSVVPSLFVSPDRIAGQQVGANIDPATPFHFDDSQAELDFILTLERPCMHHLEEAHFGPLAHPFDAHTFLDPGLQPTIHPEDDPEALYSGHVLTASMPLWQKVREDGPVKTAPEIMRRELNSLLNSSYQLGLRNEIAPVQILQLLRMRHAEIREKSITVENLNMLANELTKYLRCYGFGAVFDEDIVRKLVMQYC
ncbi:hypothetical protein NA57DRAFT_58741 [Rhizodiscina lignyota]|uniref:BZIP domain-containing protein n=1 Tax=Rhizodiscina lignyota TaxID=1504668 RepID=A0A9P4ICQ2_9PEZI|nr:hypothetical protein NA57DRAFT_58741 [Rhizodiscina lignyota]